MVMGSRVPTNSHFYSRAEATPHPSDEEETVDNRLDELRSLLPLSNPSQTTRVHRTIAQRRRLHPAKPSPTAVCRGAVENQPICSFNLSISSTPTSSTSTQVSRPLSMASTSDWNGTESAEEGPIIKMDENGCIIPDKAVDSDDMIQPKVESPGEEATMALIANHRRAADIMSPVVAKRPRGRPRKHPLPSESSNKIAKGRSKTGCITCRKRKKKCDETKPRCKSHLTLSSPVPSDECRHEL